jgi:hypothetical protein
MKQNLFKKMMVCGAILMASALVFNSCGNADNALENILKGANVSSTVFKKYNPTNQQWETMELAYSDYKKITPETVAALGNVWGAGKYLVQGSVTINNNIMGGDGKLEIYLSDDAQLTINGSLNYGDSDEGIEIHGQTNGTGQLIINSIDGPGINAKNIVIDGGKLEASSSAAEAIKISGEAGGALVLHGGHVEAKATTPEMKGVEGKVEIGGGTALFQGGANGMACTKYARSANYQRNINFYVSHDGMNWNYHDELAPGDEKNCNDRYLKVELQDF